jgi:hypothetical protein
MPPPAQPAAAPVEPEVGRVEPAAASAGAGAGPVESGVASVEPEAGRVEPSVASVDPVVGRAEPVDGAGPVPASAPASAAGPARVPDLPASASVDRSARTRADRPFADFQPANRVEARLLEVGLRGDGDAFLKALITSDVLLPVPPGLPRGVNPGSPDFPWVTAQIKGRTGVLLFTSLERLREYLGESQFIVGHCAIIARLWPRDDWALEVNPGTPVGAGLPGDRVRALADWAEEIGVIKRVPPPPEPPTRKRSVPQSSVPQSSVPQSSVPQSSVPQSSVPPSQPAADAAVPAPTQITPPTPVDTANRATAAPPAAAPASAAPAPATTAAQPESDASAPAAREQDRRRRPILQKFVPHDQVDWYLRLGYDRVAGPVYRAREMPWPGSLARLYESFGIGPRPGSPFTAGDQTVHLIRWPQYCDGLYRAGEPAHDARGRDRHDGDPDPAEYAIGSTRVPHGAQLIVLTADGAERLVAIYSADEQVWRPDADAPAAEDTATAGPPVRNTAGPPAESP